MNSEHEINTGPILQSEEAQNEEAKIKDVKTEEAKNDEAKSEEADARMEGVASRAEVKKPFFIEIPDYAVVVLIGVSGSGKSTFARTHFLPSETLSSDAFRGFVSDDENDQSATKDAFDALHYLAAIRLRRRKLVVIDATNVQSEARRPLVQLAAAHDCLAVAIVLDVPERMCQARNRTRPDRQFGPHVVINQHRQLRQSLRNLKREGFRYVFTLDERMLANAQIRRVPLWTDRRAETGPFDIIGDVHGCYDELTALLNALGYAPTADTGAWQHPQARRVCFVGDLVDRGPKVVETVRLVQSMTKAGTAFCVPGNHDIKLMRALKGNHVTVSHGLAESLVQIEALPEPEREAFKSEYLAFADSLVSHLWLDGGKLCVAHAGMKEPYIGRASGRVRDFALYGETTGETDAYGLPVRLPWAQDYRGTASVVYGHTPTPRAEWLNNTLNIDTGCVFGGSLTALRWPEREIVQVPALQTYAEQGKREEERGKREDALSGSPVPKEAKNSKAETESEKDDQAERETSNDANKEGGNNSEIASKVVRVPDSRTTFPSSPSLQWQHDELLRAEDVLGKRLITTRLLNNVTIPAENAAAALEVMSRFAVHPRWLTYLPPTMSPCETAPEGDLLERPQEAFAYYRAQGVEQVVCQRKHMGSRAVVVVCKDERAAYRCFGAANSVTGVCYTRTGRQFFDDEVLQSSLLNAIRDGLNRADFWQEYATDWVSLDCELMPWNAKAQGLLREQYAPVGAAGRTGLARSLAIVSQARSRGLPLDEVRDGLQRRQEDVARYTEAYARYCWTVNGLADMRLAPFHLLATEGQTYFDRPHAWHIEALTRLAAHSELFLATETLMVDVTDADSQARGIAWWEGLTNAGGEGMVVKPSEFIVRGAKSLVQPAVKVRGREYLRIIYGPEYTEPPHLTRLRQRGLGAKRSLALREFALGVESLERFVRQEPLRRVHECVFGVLALESEPVDPRL